LYNILIEFGISMKVIRLLKICLNEIYSKVCIGKHLPDGFPIQCGLKQGDALSPLLLNLALEYFIRVTKVRTPYRFRRFITVFTRAYHWSLF
jgi:hypothetical protein